MPLPPFHGTHAAHNANWCLAVLVHFDLVTPTLSQATAEVTAVGAAADGAEERRPTPSIDGRIVEGVGVLRVGWWLQGGFKVANIAVPSAVFQP